jgi:hypothetical protein
MSAADRVAITDGLHHYCYWVDRNRPDRQVEIFTTDCQVVFRKDRVIVGPDKVEKILQAGLEKYAATHHHLSNITIDFDGDAAAVRSYVYAWHRHVDPDAADMHLYGEYHDTWRRTPDGWRCAARTLLSAGTIPPRDDLDGIGRES